MVNYANNVRTPTVMSAPNSRFQIAELKFADSLPEVTWQDNHVRSAARITELELCRRRGDRIQA